MSHSQHKSKGITLHLVLAHHWYDQIAAGHKHIEYREMKAHWERLIWDRRETITHVRFSRGYTSTTITRRVEKIDTGNCPINGWTDCYYRIHFSDKS